MHKRSRLPDDMAKIQSAIKAVLGDGEVSVFLSKPKKRINSPKYVIMFKYANRQLIRCLPARAYLMISYLYTVCDNGNVIPLTWEEVSVDLGHKTRNVYAAVQELRNSNLVLKIGGKYYISPQIAWCGSMVQWKATMDNLTSSQRVTLPIERTRINRMNEQVIPFDKLQQKMNKA